MVRALVDFTYNGSGFHVCLDVWMDNIVMMQLICACFAITRAELVVGLDQINAKYVPSVILEVNLFASNHANQANSLSRENAYLAIKNVSHATVLTTTSVIHALLIQILA